MKITWMSSLPAAYALPSQQFHESSTPGGRGCQPSASLIRTKLRAGSEQSSRIPSTRLTRELVNLIDYTIHRASLIPLALFITWSLDPRYRQLTKGRNGGD
ncbi:hypothetical protein E2C01_088630 [Portunus trituberculatus]|uniref:Uncharacterized protein n=1 Tax=Portunus trituberculatus TaxID=210409 RepID=A0A5B7J9T3_PORTR|nr:hypothetical protein [Portunus trituberculatus]